MNTRLRIFSTWLFIITAIVFSLETLNASEPATVKQPPSPKTSAGIAPKLILPRVNRETKQRERTASSTAATFTVTNTNDAGAGSLRQAIIDANANEGADVINFGIDASGVQVISPLSSYDVITEQVFIDGWSQSGFSTTPVIEIDGSNVDGGIGFNIQASDCVIRGLAITNFPQYFEGSGNGIGIGIFGGTNNWIYGNHIGVDASGTIDRGNGQIGIWIGSDAAGDIIGTNSDGVNDAAERNIISGNDNNCGMLIQGNNNIIAGNFIGTDITGTLKIQNANDGILLQDASGNTIGGALPAARNLISANGYNGIELIGSGAINNHILGNYVGTDVSGTGTLGNYSWGVLINFGPMKNVVGGLSSGEGNIVAGNGIDGVSIYGTGTDSNRVAGNVLSANGYAGLGVRIANGNVIEGNLIGTNAAGTAAWSNGSHGIYMDGIEQYNRIGTNADGSNDAAERNIISGNNFYGIIINGSDVQYTTIAGNYIGTNKSGTAGLGNGSVGLFIADSPNNTVGGSAAGAGNVISGNPAEGILIQSSSATNNIIQGNKIGTDIAGTTAIGNNAGIFISDAPSNTVGNNLISGNNGNGIRISGSISAGTVITGNIIGANAAGNGALGNTDDGIDIDNLADHVTVGGIVPGARNIISGNYNGIEFNSAGNTANVVQGNYIGTNSTGSASIPNSNTGVVIYNTPNTLIGGTTAGTRNIISGNGNAGIYLANETATNNNIKGNFIGTDASGTLPLPNNSGVDADYYASGNYIGGTTPGERNIISGNGQRGVGLLTTSSFTYVRGNYIGTDVTGTAAVPNGSGVFIIDSPGNRIGDGSSGAGNVISGNIGDGIGLWNSGTTGTKIFGNKIGVQADGISPLGNIAGAFGGGIAIRNYTSSNTIGGTDEGQPGNIIAYNSPSGIVAYSGSENSIHINSIYQNTGLGIDLNGEGVTANDAGDGDAGANNLLNYPVLDFAASDLEGVSGSIHSDPGSSMRIEFFRSASVDPSGYGEGQTYIGSTNVATNGSGDGTFFVTFPGQLTPGQFITATSTDPDGNTSEFSAAVLIAPKVKVYGNHYVVNTTLSGIPLHWPSGKTAYRMSTSVPTTFRAAITSGLGTWDALSQLQYTNAGTTASTVWGGTPDTLNNMVWIPANWAAITGADSNTIAVTRVRYNTLNGEMTDVDIAFDAQHFAWSTVNDTLSPNMNIRNVATHEAGHFSGLGDIYEPGQPNYVSSMGSGNKEVTMFGFIRAGEFKKNSLEAPDSAGIKYIYDNIPQDRMDLVLVFDGSATFAGTYNGFTPSKNAATELVQKMRVGDRIGIVRLPNTNSYNLTQITGQATRNAAIAAISSLTAGGTSALGTGLLTAETQIDNAAVVANHGKAMILFSAGEEDTPPTALGSLPALLVKGTKAFTLGFNGSSGQALSDSIASRTGGTYYLAASTTIGTIVDEIWDKLIGQEHIADTTVTSNNIPGFPQPGLKWQGAVDPGTGSIQPGLKWQGSNFRLTLKSPDNITIDSVVAASNLTDGIEFFSGPTYNYFNIKNPKPGIWTLNVQGRVFPPQPEPVNLYILAYTDLTMDVLFNKALYVPGEPVQVTATLSKGGTTSGDSHVVGGDPVTDATVVADVFLPNSGTIQTITLTHNGNGIYKGSFLNTNKSGSYKFNVRASKPNAFNRQSTQSVFVATSFTVPSSIVVNAPPGQCSAVVNYTIALGNPLVFPGLTVVCTPPSGSTFPLGTTTVKCIGNDALGHKDTASFTITVKDNQPPVVAGAVANPGYLWPPDHSFDNVTINYTSTDNCSPVTCTLTVTSNEPERRWRRDDNDCDEDDDSSPDWIIVDAHHVKLRAERSGRRARVYTITITCADAYGNKTIKQVTVTVPKNKKDLPNSAEGLPVVASIPAHYGLSQNYPNPFNPTTKIEYALPAESRVKLTIYNTLGQSVRTLVDEVQNAGYQTAEFEANTIASGLYFYRIEATSTSDLSKSFTQIRKMILLK